MCVPLFVANKGFLLLFLLSVGRTIPENCLNGFCCGCRWHVCLSLICFTLFQPSRLILASVSSVFLFLITPQQTRSSGAGSKHTNRFVLLIESICFWIAANERAIRSDNTSEETAVRRWVTTTSAIRDQQSLKVGISSFLCRPAVSLAHTEPPHRSTASLNIRRDSSPQMGEGCEEGSGLFVDLG